MLLSGRIRHCMYRWKVALTTLGKLTVTGSYRGPWQGFSQFTRLNEKPRKRVKDPGGMAVLRRVIVREKEAALDVLLETHIGDYKNVDCDWELSGPWTGFTQVTTLSEKPPNGFTWSRGRLTKVQANPRPDYVCARRMVKCVEKRPTDRNSIRLLKSQTSIKLEG